MLVLADRSAAQQYRRDNQADEAEQVTRQTGVLRLGPALAVLAFLALLSAWPVALYLTLLGWRA